MIKEPARAEDDDWVEEDPDCVDVLVDAGIV